MARKTQPIGNPSNPYAWVNAFEGQERHSFQTQLVKLDVNSFDRQDQFRLKRGLGEAKFDKLIKARYDWLFDDLQKFSTIGAEQINSKEDLRAFVEDTIGNSVGFQNMNKSKFDRSVSKATESFWNKGGVKTIATTNVVEVVEPEQAKAFSFRVREDKRERFIEASRNKELFRIRRERFALLRTDKRGRVYFFDAQTGRRVANPQKTLAELGLEQ